MRFILTILAGNSFVEFLDKYGECDLSGIEVHGRGAITRHKTNKQ